MIFITLGQPVMTNGEIERICKEHDDLDKDLLKSISECKTVVMEDDNGNVRTEKLKLGEMDGKYTGAEGCRMYLGSHFIDENDYKMLNIIELPCDVYEKSRCPEWADISQTLSEIEQCSQRIMLYCEMGIDCGFIVIEESLLKKLVEILIGDDGYRDYCKKLPDDYATLHTIGFRMPVR